MPRLLPYSLLLLGEIQCKSPYLAEFPYSVDLETVILRREPIIYKAYACAPGADVNTLSEISATLR